LINQEIRNERTKIVEIVRIAPVVIIPTLAESTFGGNTTKK
jgi:hypothetical protein